MDPPNFYPSLSTVLWFLMKGTNIPMGLVEARDDQKLLTKTRLTGKMPAEQPIVRKSYMLPYFTLAPRQLSDLGSSFIFQRITPPPRVSRVVQW